VPAASAPVSKETAAPATKPEPRAEKADSETNVDEPPQLQVPRVTLPEIPIENAGQLAESDFARGVATPSGGVANVSSTPSFTPHTVRPELRNREIVQRALTEYYPRVLRERNIGGTVGLWILVDTAGRVQRSQVRQSSGNEFLDEAALKVADAMQFTPALNRDKKVSVWIQLPIIFRTR
jgi:protein TonB